MADALGLPPALRALVAEKLLESLDEPDAAPLSAKWRQELRQRCAEVDAARWNSAMPMPSLPTPTHIARHPSCRHGRAARGGTSRTPTSTTRISRRHRPGDGGATFSLERRRAWCNHAPTGWNTASFLPVGTGVSPVSRRSATPAATTCRMATCCYDVIMWWTGTSLTIPKNGQSAARVTKFWRTGLFQMYSVFWT